MSKVNIQLFLFIAIPVLLVVGILSGIIFFGYRVYTDLQTLKTQVAWLSNTSTSTAPLMQAAGAGARENFAALCVLSQNPQICQAAGISLQAPQTPQK